MGRKESFYKVIKKSAPNKGSSTHFGGDAKLYVRESTSYYETHAKFPNPFVGVQHATTGVQFINVYRPLHRLRVCPTYRNNSLKLLRQAKFMTIEPHSCVHKMKKSQIFCRRPPVAYQPYKGLRDSRRDTFQRWNNEIRSKPKSHSANCSQPNTTYGRLVILIWAKIKSDEIEPPFKVYFLLMWSQPMRINRLKLEAVQCSFTRQTRNERRTFLTCTWYSTFWRLVWKITRSRAISSAFAYFLSVISITPHQF